MLSPNEKYAALVAAAGYLPLTLTGEEYLELQPRDLLDIVPVDYAAERADPTRATQGGRTAKRAAG
jgi:putative transposase